MLLIVIQNKQFETEIPWYETTVTALFNTNRRRSCKANVFVAMLNEALKNVEDPRRDITNRYLFEFVTKGISFLLSIMCTIGQIQNSMYRALSLIQFDSAWDVRIEIFVSCFRGVHHHYSVIMRCSVTLFHHKRNTTNSNSVTTVTPPAEIQSVAF